MPLVVLTTSRVSTEAMGIMDREIMALMDKIKHFFHQSARCLRLNLLIKVCRLHKALPPLVSVGLLDHKQVSKVSRHNSTKTKFPSQITETLVASKPVLRYTYRLKIGIAQY